MAFVNAYKPIDYTTVDLSPQFQDPYDVNCIVPVPAALESERVKLVPFIPSIHSDPFYDIFRTDPTQEKHTAFRFPTLDSFNFFVEYIIRRDPRALLFVVIDKTKPANDPTVSIAGFIGLYAISLERLSAQVVAVSVLPTFKRTFISSNMIGLLAKYVLDLPAHGGLGFRRLFWEASRLNEASVYAAERMGFKREGVSRWNYQMPDGSEGDFVSEERGGGKGMDYVVLSICWDDWDGGVKELVEKQMNRIV